jgi:hypothetical protein
LYIKNRVVLLLIALQLNSEYLFRLLANESCTLDFARYFQFLCITILYKTVTTQSIACLPHLKQKAQQVHGADLCTTEIYSGIAFMEDRIISHFIENPGKSFAARFESNYYSAIVLRSKPCRSGIVYLSDPGSDESEKEESRAKQSETRDENWECASASTFGGPSVSGFESNEEEDWEPADGMDVVPDAELQGDGEDGSDSGESFGKNMGYGSESASGKESEGEDFKGFCVEDSGFSDESSDELDSNFGD